MGLFEPFGVEAEFLGHLDQLLRSLRILDRFGEPPRSDGLVPVMIGLSHGNTFLDTYGLRQKGSMRGWSPANPREVGRLILHDAVGAGGASNGILRRRRCRKTHPLFVPGEQKESCAAIDLELGRRSRLIAEIR